MFIKDKDSLESFIHICDGKTEKHMRTKGIEVRLHDVSTFTVVTNEKGNPAVEAIYFCPYCGCDLQVDAFPIH